MRNAKTIIFSKDRACQLQACLDSYHKHFDGGHGDDVSILWRATTPAFHRGYEKLQEIYPESHELEWIEEYNFYRQVQELLQGINPTRKQVTMFLVDDIIFTDSVKMSDHQVDMVENNPEWVIACSLRLHRGVNYCYAEQRHVTPPRLIKGNLWDWRKADGDWGYPMSVDGNLYNTPILKSLVPKLSFDSPNTFEAALVNHVNSTQGWPTYMCCYPAGPRLINIPANRVQNTFPNHQLNSWSAEELNTRYLNGAEIDVDHYEKVSPTSVHVEEDICFI